MLKYKIFQELWAILQEEYWIIKNTAIAARKEWRKKKNWEKRENVKTAELNSKEENKQNFWKMCQKVVANILIKKKSQLLLKRETLYKNYTKIVTKWKW